MCIRDRRHIIHAAAPCPADVKRAMIEWWGPVIYEFYGSTESGAVTFANSEDALKKPGTVGKIAPGAELRFVGDDGKVLPQGEIGEIFARVPAYADFTYLNHEEKRKSVERDGLISLGDVGYMKEGRLYLCDRRSDMVIFGGTNIYPAEIEMVLTQCPGVKDCAVFGIPDDDFGESLAAAVERMPESQVTPEEIRSYLLERLAKFKVPKRIEFRAELARTATGKLQKFKLRETYWVDFDRQVN